MNPLWDKATVRSLARAVRQTSPDDWKASRTRSTRGWFSRKAWGERFWAVTSLILIGVFMCVDTLLDKPQMMALPAACGLIALNFLGLGLIAAQRIFSHDVPDVQPLVNTPAQGRQVYVYVLFLIQKRAWIKCLSLIIIGSTPMLLMRVIVTDTLTWETAAQAIAGGTLIVGSSLAFGVLLLMLPSPLDRIFRVFFGAFMLLLSWQFLRLFIRPLSSPVFIGENAQFLPQAQIVQWVLGGAFPTGPVLGCAGALLLAVFFITHHLRDRGHAFADEAPADGLEWRAETYAAQAIRQWHHGIHDSAYKDEESTEIGDETGHFPEDESVPLLVHPDAPREHATPVSEEFRTAIATRCREILQTNGPGCPLEKSLWPLAPESTQMKTAWKMALYTGISVPLLAEATAWLPDMWREQHGIWFILAAFLLLVINLGFTRMALPYSVPLTLSQWVRLPVDPAIHARHFFACQRRHLLQRFLLLLMIVAVIATTSLLWIGLRSIVGITTQGPLTLASFIHGELSLVTLTFMLFVGALAIRYVETMKFFRVFFTFIEWRGFWKRISLFYGFMLLISAAALLSATGIAIFLSATEISQGRHWITLPACLLMSEAVHQLNVWLALQAARRGRGDWNGDAP
ncbi:hypothetical protein EI77_03678 [Prosthecobacter fusiformis]|uniref:Uncharacterized protein n=1 Tax=Prosthecobacter fusiformis TaxID=48464 RepID=A0A4V3FED8_9BACT|nr:hypothetical protein [Prosthecobacter fusiformis]TDU66583.1 hypothetical protein EI77_03678 [Prosthecobacter fusiformis]